MIHLVLAIALFTLMGWIGAHSRSYGYQSLSLSERVQEAPAFNALYRIMAPQVFIIIISAIFSLSGAFHYARDIWHVTILYFVVRWLFIIFMGRRLLINWVSQSAYLIAASAISYWLSTRVLTNPANALPDAQNFRSDLWLIVLVFIYQTVNGVNSSGTGQEKRQLSHIDSRFQEFRHRYDSIISDMTSDRWIHALIYATMIYEDFNRPLLTRMIESSVLFPLGLAKSLGPMQVKTDRLISDEESVRLGSDILIAAYTEARRSRPEWSPSPSWIVGHAQMAAVKYNPDHSYSMEVGSIFDRIVHRFYNDLVPTSSSND